MIFATVIGISAGVEAGISGGAGEAVVLVFCRLAGEGTARVANIMEA